MAKSKLTRLRKDCDKLMQIKGMELCNKCEVCGKEAHCRHHFFPKSTSAILRYDWDNLIPICQGCHMQHHLNGNPRIHAMIIKKRGQEWFDTLEAKSRQTIKINQGYYKEIKELLSA